MWTASVLPVPLAYSPNLLKLTSHITTTTNSSSNSNSTTKLIQDGHHYFNKFVKANTKFNSAVSNHNNNGFWKKWKENSAEMSSKLAKLGLSAVLDYGWIDGVTYTSFFVLAFLGYEKSAGKNPAANLQALLVIEILILMWTGNNVTRPFRVAGAAALAPDIDEGLRRIQKYFNFPSISFPFLVYAFVLVVGMVAALCSTVIGLLIFSRWGK